VTDDSGRPPDGEDSGSLDPTHAFVSPASAAGRTPRDQAPPATPAPPPRRIGPYEILDLLGEGGMGTVYLAEQTEPLRRRVAVKLIRAGELRSERAARFRAEGRALARMSHPCVAQVFEAGVTDDGQPFLVMELVSGEGIVERCDRRRLSLEERLRLFVEVCHGVQHAHQKGIIHRDLKPTNVLVCEVDGRAVPKLIDFGIAKGIDEPLLDRTALTADRRVVGTPAYVSPEMIQGEDEEPPDIDTRSDVYSLGVVLYELLTGVLPFGQSARSFVQITTSPACIASKATTRSPRPSTAARGRSGRRRSAQTTRTWPRATTTSRTSTATAASSRSPSASTGGPPRSAA
jgi:serine/threonine protein kinase